MTAPKEDERALHARAFANLIGLRARKPLSHRRERLVEVGEDVVDMLDADRKADIAVGDAGLQLLFGVSCECVVEAGWIAKLRASPILATW